MIERDAGGSRPHLADLPAAVSDGGLKGMPYSYNKAIIDHPDMKEFLEGQWMARIRYGERIAELESEVKDLRAALIRIGSNAIAVGEDRREK